MASLDGKRRRCGWKTGCRKTLLLLDLMLAFRKMPMIGIGLLLLGLDLLASVKMGLGERSTRVAVVGLVALRRTLMMYSRVKLSR